ncbi:glycoside hydrolase family 2 TIM barrel-domain containing protein [Paraglaciecola sp. L3A3]|uniref:glycoside hydrolase family 2 protein n=1 Tax=Paraglaciecola sp. L3A3 TaxID=2686358 RepID=UPI00131C52C5|nr:glycoside hydrolase family 2 TIM barrel-domain containing protein [Paraglaciecola sp. L3A3]
MKLSIKVLSLLGLLLASILSIAQELPSGYPKTERTKLMLTSGWKFHLGEPEAKYYASDFDDGSWQNVTVPHTLELTSLALNGVKDSKVQETFQRKVGWYKRTISVSADNSKKVFLEFEGAHQETNLWVNGQHAGNHAVSGYTPFIFDISDYVKYGAENQITLLVDNRRSQHIPPDPGPFDYVKFSGLYRDVYLVETAPVRITFNIEGMNHGITITTPSVDPVNLNATLDVKTHVINQSNSEQNIQLINRVVDKSGAVVLKLTDNKVLKAGQSFEFNQIGGIEDGLHLWSTENPYLYKLNTLLLVDGKALDVADNNVGFRKFEFDQINGFKLNNKPIELMGFNRHQHYGYIGDALPNSLHKKDMQQFKDLGFNVMRTAHYPQDDAILQACDELGILVYEEAPTWTGMQNSGKWWDNLEASARTMVRNHRNHPSVIIWGAGINHRGYVPRLHYSVKQEDPTRLTASQSSRWTGWQSSGLTDVFANMNYGPGEWARHEQLLAMEGRTGPEVIAEYKNDPMKTGMIAWTAHAYYTFHDIGVWDDRTRGGMLTSFRSVKNPKIMWYPTELTNTPSLYVKDPWTEQTKLLTIYSNADEIELAVNGQSKGRFKPSTALKYIGIDHPPYEIPVSFYEEGKLTVTGFINGQQVLQQERYTPGKPYKINLKLDTKDRILAADGNDILVGYAEILDKNGMLLPDAEAEVEFSISGPAEIIGDKANIQANPAKVRLGVAPILVRAGTKAGSIKIRAKAKGLKSDSVKIRSQAVSKDALLVSAYPIKDYAKIRVDMGAQDQLVQFGWDAWYGQDNQGASQHFDDFGGFDASLLSNSEQGVLRWLGEMNVIGLYGYVYGEGVLGIDKQGISLIFDGLEKGQYSIKTYHHAPRSNTDSMDPNLDKLKSITIHKLPYATTLEALVSDASGAWNVEDIAVTEGKSLQLGQPGSQIITFEADGTNPVSIVFRDPKGEKGIWLNGFELTSLKNLH